MIIDGESFSYSKLSTYKDCGYKYKLIYVDKHRVSVDSIATLFGSLVHFIEESIGNIIIDKGVDYLVENHTIFDDHINIFLHVGKEDEKIYCVDKLKEMFPDQFYEEDKNGLTYQDKVDYYTEYGIYRLSDYLLENPDIQLLYTEHEFRFNYKNIELHGFIDRLYKNKKNNTYIIEDIKTYSADITTKKLRAPLQMVVYTLALRSTEPDCQVHCQYELPLIGARPSVRNRKYLEIGCDDMDSILEGIVKEEFIPNPTPLCHWCQFCPTNPEQKEEGKNLCPYYSKWTRENKTFAVLNHWQGVEKDKILVEKLQGLKRNPTVSTLRIIRRR